MLHTEKSFLNLVKFKQNLDCNYTAPIDLAHQFGVPIGATSIGKMLLQFKFGFEFNKIQKRFLSVCACCYPGHNYIRRNCINYCIIYILNIYIYVLYKPLALVNYEWPIRTKFLSLVTYGSPPWHSNSLKPLKIIGKIWNTFLWPLYD